jgi:hypothetical protein
LTLTIERQDSYSRGELLLRSILGPIYILIPHIFVLGLVSIAASVVGFLAFWAILFTGSYPEGFYNFLLGSLRWQNRLSATLYQLVDGYPVFGFIDAENVKTECPRPASVSRGSLLLRAILGIIYVGIPHGVALGVRQIGSSVLVFLAFWVVLFTGEYPERWHAFNVGSLRWNARLSAYLLWMTGEYPPFSGQA